MYVIETCHARHVWRCYGLKGHKLMKTYEFQRSVYRNQKQKSIESISMMYTINLHIFMPINFHELRNEGNVMLMFGIA